MAEETIVIDAATDLVIHTTDRSSTTWIWCQNSHVLYNERHRGEDRVLPGIGGVSGNPRVRDAIVFPLQLVIRGTSHDNLRANIEAAKAACVPVTSGDGTRTVTWNLPDGVTVRTGACHVGPLEMGQAIGPLAVRATLDLQLDLGVWS